MSENSNPEPLPDPLAGENEVSDPHPDPEAGTEEETITLKRSHFYGGLIPIAFILGIAVGFVFWGRAGSSAPAPAAAANPAPVGPVSAANQAEANTAAQPPSASGEEEPIPRFDIPVDDDPILGPDDAPITIIEFSDYECPYCRKFHVETFNQLIEAYPDQVRFVYRDFPLSTIHSNAIAASEAANCAHEQGVFWEYHDLLFSMQQGLSKDAYLAYAEQLNLDMTEFESCIDSRRYEDEVASDYDFAARLGIRSTPTFFINGLPLVGAQPFEVFKQVIDKELAGEIPG